jgi:flagellin-like protein
MIPDKIRSDDHAVSPVIGVILMVAITVILAAVIGTFVLGIGSSQSQNASAGIDYDANTDTVTVVSLDNADTVKCSNNPSSQQSSSVGGTFTCADGESVIAVLDGDENVIRTNLPA